MLRPGRFGPGPGQTAYEHHGLYMSITGCAYAFGQETPLIGYEAYGVRLTRPCCVNESFVRIPWPLGWCRAFTRRRILTCRHILT